MKTKQQAKQVSLSVSQALAFAQENYKELQERKHQDKKKSYIASIILSNYISVKGLIDNYKSDTLTLDQNRTTAYNIGGLMEIALNHQYKHYINKRNYTIGHDLKGHTQQVEIKLCQDDRHASNFINEDNKGFYMMWYKKDKIFYTYVNGKLKKRHYKKGKTQKKNNGQVGYRGNHKIRKAILNDKDFNGVIKQLKPIN